jgi:NAD(P)-dependent dehydrogenase (short-subunit alcohol dehydrogenase family)
LSGIKGKSVLITGAGRGIGKRLAVGFALEGARVGLLARTQAELDLAKLEIDRRAARRCGCAPTCAIWKSWLTPWAHARRV